MHIPILFITIIFFISFFIVITDNIGNKLIIVLLLILILIPPDAAYLFTNASYNGAPGTVKGLLRVHPLTLIVIPFLFWVLLLKASLLTRALRHNRYAKTFLLIQFFFIVIVIVETLITRGFRGTMQILENYIVPLFFFILIIISVTDEKDIKKVWINTILYSAIILAIYSIFEFITEINPYSSFYTKAGTSYNDYIKTGYRSFTTLGHPLNNGLFFVSAIPFVFFLSSNFKRYTSHLILLLGIIATGSRVSTILGFISIIGYYLYLIKEEKNKSLIKFVTVSSVFLFIYIIIFYTDFADFLIFRLFNDTGSSQIRLTVLNYFARSWYKNIFNVLGIGGSSDLSYQILGTQNSFEIPWLIMFVEIGFIPLMLYLISILYPLHIYFKNKKNISNENLRIIIISYILMLINTTTYSSIGVKSHFSYLFYGIVAICFIYLRIVFNPKQKNNVPYKNFV